MASLYSMEHITYDPIDGYFYKGKKFLKQRLKN